jgi:hypothetical protein
MNFQSDQRIVARVTDTTQPQFTRRQN